MERGVGCSHLGVEAAECLLCLWGPVHVSLTRYFVVRYGGISHPCTHWEGSGLSSFTVGSLSSEGHGMKTNLGLKLTFPC